MPIVPKFDYTIEQMMELQKTLPKDQEGFIVRFADGLRVKIKGEEYLRIHRLISQVTPLAFWDVMVEGKVRADFLKELPEEYRTEADKIVKVLENKYMNLKHDIINEFVGVYPATYNPENRDKDVRKHIGLNMKNYQHGGAFFSVLDQNQKALDTYILKKIRPNGNVL
jgi:RNA ligase